MKKIVSFIMIFTILFTSPFRADANPGVVVVGTVAMGAALLTVGGVTYYKPLSSDLPSGISHYVSVVGASGRILYTSWQDYSAYSTSVIKNKLVTAKIAFTDLKNLVLTSAGRVQWPSITNLLESSTVLTASESAMSSASIGAVFAYNGNNYTLYSKGTQGNNAAIAGHWVPVSNSTDYKYEWTTDEDYFSDPYTLHINYFHLGGTGSVVQKTAAEYAALVAALDAASRGIYQGDIDNFITGNPNVVKFVDTASPSSDLDTALPFVPPAAVAPPSTVTGLGADTKTAAQTRLDAAKAAAAAAATALAADPTNQALIDAKAAADAEVAAASKALDNATAATNEKYIDEKSPDLKSLDFNRWKNFLNILQTVWPFTLIGTLSAYLSAIIREPVAPSFDLPIYQTTSLHISLSIFDPVAQLVRWCIALLISVAVVQRIIAWYKGESL